MKKSELIDVKSFDRPIRVACVGDSITEFSSYPKDLAAMLKAEYDLSKYRAANYHVGNFGCSGATVLSSGKPYIQQPRFQKAKDYKPHVIVLMLGTNDSRRGKTYEKIAQFVPEYKALIAEFQALETKPRILLCLPVPIYKQGNWGLNNENLLEGVIPGVKQVAKDLNLPLVDMHAPLSGHPEWFSDNVHPSGLGPKTIAATAYRAITGLAPPAALLPPPAEAPGENLLANPGAEDGLSGWMCRGGKLQAVNEPVHSGKSAVKLTQRRGGADGAGQDITEVLKKAGQGDYFYKGFVRLATTQPASAPTSTPATGKAPPQPTCNITVLLTDERGSRYVSSQRSPVSAADWSACVTVGSLRWTGTLKSAIIYVETSCKDDLLVDDLTLIKYEYPVPKDAKETK
jgi:lysophospholipase L1-like esterase